MTTKSQSPAIVAGRVIGQRLDKWLWFARVVKSRSLAARLVAEGGVRVNRGKVDKPGTIIKPGDVLTIGLPNRVRVLAVKLPGERRGPAAEAALLFDDLTPIAATPVA